jgi:hypothetical protein
MDAINFRSNTKAQWTTGNITRELNKAYIAFTGDPAEATF